MADFNEHVLKVRAALDKASQQEMRETMRSIFTDESHIDFNNPENIKGLRALADAMEKIFTKAGNTKFDFSKMIRMPGPELFDELKKAALEFDAVWSSIVTNMGNIGDGISQGIANGIVDGVSAGVDSAIKEAEAKLDGLFKAQAEKMKQIEDLRDKQRKKEEMMNRLDFDNAFEIDTKIKYTSDEDLKKQVREIEGVYKDAFADLMDAADNDKVTEPVLQRFKDAAQEMLKVRNTIEDLTEKQIRQQVNGRSTFTNKAEALFGSSFVEKMLGDESDSLEVQIGDAMDIFTDLFDLEDIVIDIGSVQKELKGIEREIENITSQHPELIERKEAAEAEERLNKIREAYERLFTSRDSKTLKKGSLKEKDLKHIENSLAYKGHGDNIKALPADASDAQLARQAKVSAKAREKLEEAFRLYDESDSQKWEVRAQYLIKAVAEYESILNNPNASQDLLDGYESQYQVLKDQAVAEREKLEAVVDMARSVHQGPQQSNVDDVEKVAQSNNEAADATQQKREEEEKFAQAQEQSVKAASEQVAFEEKEKALILERKEILAEMLRMSNEAGLFFDSKTGNTSDIVEGGAHSVETTLGAWKQAATEFDTRLHSHNYDVAAPSISGAENDFNVWIKGFEHIRKQMILANKELLAFDFSSLKSVDVLKEIAAKYRVAAAPILEKFNPRHNMKAIEAHGGIQGFMEAEQAELRQALETIMSEYPGVMKSYKLSPDIIEISKDANFKGSATGSYQDKVEPIKKEADAHRVNAEAIKEETRAQEELNNIKNQNIDVDDDAETLAKENGALADKLELLQEIAEQYGNNISQKQRDRYEELNQKDMNEGLTPKEDERYWELGEQIEEADSALEEFGQTYDKIIVKLANGKKVEILPDDKGLRTLAKIDEEYGESYNGVEIEDITFERVKQEAIATEQAVDGLNESLEKTQQLTSGDGTGTGTGDASSAELEAARAEAEQQRLANEQLVDEKLTLQNDLDVANAQIKLAQDSEMSARAELYEVEQQLADEQHEKSVYDAALTEMTDELHAKDVEIYDLREQLANVDTEVGDAKTSFDADELKNILNAITYNVKVIQDADSTENKVAIDETSLEATLTKVFTNILNPQTIQNDSTTVQSPWAHETTLQAVKSVLESMDQKIAKGGTVTKKDSGVPSKKESNNDSQKQTGRTTAIRSLTSDYEALGKLRAQYEKDGNLETKARLQNLAEEVRYKKQSLDLTTDEVIALRQRSDVAYDAEKRLIAAAKAQKAIDDKRKAADKNTKQQAKDAENAWKKRVKEAQRATGINAATSTANAGDQTVIRTIGTENLSDDVENKARELSDQIVALRKLRDEIDAKGDKATQEDRDDLSEQISKVKELKAELDGYLKVHEKYSGDNATTIEGDADVFKNLDMKAYEQQLTSAVMAATDGKAKISGFNAETKELTYTVKTGAHTFTTYTAAVDQVGNRLASLQGQTKHTETILAAITRKTKEIFTYFSGSSIIFKFFNEIKRGIQYVRDIDLALTELKKVTDETEETYERFLDTAAKTANKVGSTIQKVISSTADWARLGYSMKEAAQFAETTQVLMNVSEFTDVSQATDTLISSVQAFGYTAETSMDVVDLLNTIGNNYAISTADLAQSLTKSSASLVAAGGDLAEAAALTATANKIIQDADSVGTALKTTSLRLRGTDVSVLEEEGLDSDGAVTSKSKLQGKVKALSGVDILTDTGAYKSTYEILSEIADVWEDINNMDQAALLELISGKRNASVVAAILQNPKELKAAYEDAMNAEGSALKENEKYLNSIQGKIDQFNNATQSMWSNFLDADMVKWIVELGTGLIKIVDTIGLIPSILAAILTYKLAIGVAKMFDLGSLGTYISMLFTANSATEVQGLLINKNAILQKLMNSTLIQAQAARMGLTAADLAGYSATQLLTLGVKGLAAGFKNLWVAMGPVGWAILAIIAAVTILTVGFNSAYKTAEELAEELSDLKSELKDIKSEIDSLNSELQTTQDRMAELLAMPSLSFVEQEELNTLKQTTAELERQLKLKEMLSDSKQDALTALSEQYIDNVWYSTGTDKAYNIDDSGVISEDAWYTEGDDTKEALNQAFKKYKQYQDVIDGYDELISNWDQDKKVQDKPYVPGYGDIDPAAFSYEQLRNIDDAIGHRQQLINDQQRIAQSIDMILLDENFDDLKYGDSDKINAFLDEIYAYQYKWQETRGIASKSSAIASIFDDTSSESIQKLKEDLTSIASDDSLDAAKKQEEALKLVNNAINNTTGDYDRLKTSMDIIGISADEVARYFTQLSQDPDSSTIEGVTAQYQKGIEALGKYKDNADAIIAEFTELDGTVTQLKFSDLFDSETGEVIDAQISKILQGADETTRTEFARIVEAVNEGKMSVDTAIKSFSISGVQGGYKLLENAVVDINSDIFKDLGDEISGLIDTFEEFGSALESVANSIELVNQAQAEMAYSGHLSIETALALINSTEDWNKVLKIENGNITLVDGAMDILAQSKLNQIKTNLQLALSEAQAGLEQARLAESSGEVAKTIEESTTESVRQLAANMEYLSALIGEFLDGNFRDAGSVAAGAKQKSLQSTAYQKTSTTSSMSVADWEEKVSDIEAKLGILEGADTTGEFSENYYSDKVSGGNATKEDVADDAFQREMDYWENRIAANQAKYDQLQNEIDLLDKKGQKADTSYYEEQIKLEGQRLELLNGQKKAAKTYLSTLEEGSEKWF